MVFFIGISEQRPASEVQSERSFNKIIMISCPQGTRTELAVCSKRCSDREHQDPQKWGGLAFFFTLENTYYQSVVLPEMTISEFVLNKTSRIKRAMLTQKTHVLKIELYMGHT